MDKKNYPYPVMWEFLKGWILASIKHDVQSSIDYEEYGEGEDQEYIRGYTDCDIFLYYLMGVIEKEPFDLLSDGDSIYRKIKNGYEGLQKLKDKFFKEYLNERGEVI